MSLLDSIREKTDQLIDQTSGYFRVEVDEVTKQREGNLEPYSVYQAYLFEQGHENPYPLFAINSITEQEYPAELRITKEREIEPIQINSLDELRSNLDTILQDDFLKEHTRVVPRRPQFRKSES